MTSDHGPILPSPVLPIEPVQRFTILVTDDDRGNRKTLSGLLSDRGFETLEAARGEEAIEITRAETVHLVFLDMQMPGLTGLETLEQVRIFNALLPAILMTADATRDVIRQALQAQVYSVLPKPLNKTLVVHTLTRALNVVYGSPQPQEEPHPPKE